MDIVEHSTDWIEFDAETDEVPFLHMHDMIEVKYINGIDLSSPVPAWSVDFDSSRYPVTAYRVIKKADASEIAQWRELPKWKQVFVEQPPRPSPKDCINAVMDRVAQKVLERRAIRKSQKQMGE